MNIIKPNKFHIFRTILIILLILFFINHYSIKNGYQENKIHNQTIITKNNIEQFEKDIKNNEYIDIKNYNKQDTIDTNNTLSKIGYKTSETINNLVTKTTKEIYKILKLLFT